MTSPIQIGSYTIERLLGVGSFATVWLGFEPPSAPTSRSRSWPRTGAMLSGRGPPAAPAIERERVGVGHRTARARHRCERADQLPLAAVAIRVRRGDRQVAAGGNVVAVVRRTDASPAPRQSPEMRRAELMPRSLWRMSRGCRGMTPDEAGSGGGIAVIAGDPITIEGFYRRVGPVARGSCSPCRLLRRALVAPVADRDGGAGSSPAGVVFTRASLRVQAGTR